MSYLAPDLVPGRHMIDAQISHDDFYVVIGELKPGLARHLLYVTESKSLLVAPLYQLAAVDEERMNAENPRRPNELNPGRADYLRTLTSEWVAIIARASVEHPQRKAIIAGMNSALDGDLPTQPVWTKHFHDCLITGDDDTVRLKPISTLTRKAKDGGTWGLSTEPAAELLTVLKALGFGVPSKVNPGRTPKRQS
jgi:hypothetical protein